MDRSRIVATARGLLREQGLAGLTMRALAGRLGCAPMSLYRHVDSKDHLLGLVADSLAGDVDLGDPERDWRDALTRIAFSLRRLMLQHQGLAQEVISRSLATPGITRVLDAVLRALRAAGLSLDAAVRAQAGVWMLTVGGVLLEESLAAGFPRPGADRTDHQRFLANVEAAGVSALPALAAALPYWVTLDREEEFASALELLLDGIGAHAAGGPAGPLGR